MSANDATELGEWIQKSIASMAEREPVADDFSWVTPAVDEYLANHVEAVSADPLSQFEQSCELCKLARQRGVGGRGDE